jgi:hypothetical protein
MRIKELRSMQGAEQKMTQVWRGAQGVTQALAFRRRKAERAKPASPQAMLNAIKERSE